MADQTAGAVGDWFRCKFRTRGAMVVAAGENGEQVVAAEFFLGDILRGLSDQMAASPELLGKLLTAAEPLIQVITDAEMLRLSSTDSATDRMNEELDE